MDKMVNFTTEYREQSRKQNILEDKSCKKIHSFYDKVTPAGKSQYLPRAVD